MSERVGHVWRVRPGRAADYDRLHARIWPELCRLLREAGVREYHIYRWGEIVFSHMEVDDFDRLVKRFADDAVARRWEEEMAEVIDYPNADRETGWPERLAHVWSL
jgi:L-rhamnose mutarotase